MRPPRGRLALLAGTVVVTLVAALAFGALLLGSPPAPAGTPLRPGFVLHRPLPAMPLLDEHGTTTSLAAYRGKVIVLSPVATLCGESCPITVGTLLELERGIAAAGLANRIQIVTASVDPWRDTPDRLHAYRSRFGAPSGQDWPLLTGTPAQLARFWSFFHIGYGRQPAGTPPETDWMTGRPQTFDVWHTDVTFLIDPDGTERTVLLGTPVPSHPLPAALTAMLSNQGRADLAHPTPDGWTAARALQTAVALLPAQPNRLTLPSVTDPATRISLDAYAGRPVVLNFFASWCAPCRTETPLLARFASGGGRVGVIGVDVGEQGPAAQAFLRNAGVGYPVGADPGSVTARSYGVVALPQTFFLDASHRVAGRFFGPLTATELAARTAGL